MPTNPEASERFARVVDKTLLEIATNPSDDLGRVDLTTVNVDDIAVFDPQQGSDRPEGYDRR